MERLNYFINYYEQMAAHAEQVGLMGSAAYYNKMVVVSWADAMRHAIHLD